MHKDVSRSEQTIGCSHCTCHCRGISLYLLHCIFQSCYGIQKRKQLLFSTRRGSDSVQSPRDTSVQFSMPTWQLALSSRSVTNASFCSWNLAVVSGRPKGAIGMFLCFCNGKIFSGPKSLKPRLEFCVNPAADKCNEQLFKKKENSQECSENCPKIRFKMGDG